MISYLPARQWSRAVSLSTSPTTPLYLGAEGDEKLTSNFATRTKKVVSVFGNFS